MLSVGPIEFNEWLQSDYGKSVFNAPFGDKEPFDVILKNRLLRAFEGGAACAEKVYRKKLVQDFENKLP